MLEKINSAQDVKKLNIEEQKKFVEIMVDSIDSGYFNTPLQILNMKKATSYGSLNYFIPAPSKDSSISFTEMTFFNPITFVPFFSAS